MILLQENSTFAGRYRVVGRLGTGGMGAVYEVVHSETGRHLALKVMHPDIVSSAELRERFKNEARVAAQIDSEGVVAVLDAGIDESTQVPFLVMELLRGEELGKRLARTGRLAPPEALEYLRQVAVALDKTHRANIIHRDLKPENLFIAWREDAPPKIKILDFGIAKLVAETATKSGQTRSVGTPLYMAPEQFHTGQVTHACDAYALAMVAYTVLVGEAYWEPEARASESPIAFALGASQGPREPATVRAARRHVTLPPAFDAWFARATAVDPAHRFGAASTTIEALAHALSLASPSSAPQVGVNPHAATVRAASAPPPALPQQAPSGYAQPSWTPQGMAHPGQASAAPMGHSSAPGHMSVPPQAYGTPPPVASPAAPRAHGSPALWVLSTIGVMTILFVGLVVIFYVVGSSKASHARSASDDDETSEPKHKHAKATETAAADPIPPPKPPAPTATATTPVAPSAPASAAPPAKKVIHWRDRGRECGKIPESKICDPCCELDDRLVPYPSCKCVFDGDKWDLEHGKGT